MNELGRLVLFDWEEVLIEGPLMERFVSAASLRLAITRRELQGAVDGIDAGELASGDVSLGDLTQVLGESLDQDVSEDDVRACLEACLLYKTDGLARFGAWAAREAAAVVGGSPPVVPEVLRKALGGLIPPERHLYAHEAGVTLVDPTFYSTAEEAFGFPLASMTLFSHNQEAIVVAREAGCDVVVTADGLDSPPEPEDEGDEGEGIPADEGDAGDEGQGAVG